MRALEIEDRQQASLVNFGKLAIMMLFRCDGTLYMKISEAGDDRFRVNALRLSGDMAGVLSSFKNTEKVSPVDATLTVH